MARFRRRAPRDGAGPPRETQHTIFERMDGLARRAEAPDPSGPAQALFRTVLALMGFGLLMQASHAATTLDPAAFRAALQGQVLFRCGAVLVLLVACRLGPHGLRRFLPALFVLSALSLVLVFVEPFAATRNGAHRWLQVPLTGVSFQPSELARVVMILWIADRCMRLGPRVRDMKEGVLPMLFTGLGLCALILIEPDFGGAMLFLISFCATMWVGGARPVHVAGSLVGFGGGALLVAVSFLSHVRNRIEMWLGDVHNHQVDRTAEAIASGNWLGVGLGQGLFRNARVPYLDSDYVFALIGEELGLLGLLVVVGLFACFAWSSLRLVLSIRDRYRALAAFGLLLSVGLQAMLHMQVVTRLAPPKGMTLPFVSHGGTALIVSSLAVGLALGAAREPRRRTAPQGLGALRAEPHAP
jgi:cell division protein FtsW